MTTTKEPEAAATATTANGSADAVRVAAHTGEEEDEQELGLASEEREEILIRVDPLQQQNASPLDIDKGLRLIQLCRDGSLLAVKTHISEGSPAGFVSKTGWTPLAAAAYSGKADIVSYLLEIGADMMYTTSRRNNNNNNNSSSSALSDNSLLHHSSIAGSAKAPTDSHYGHTNSRPSCGVNTPLHWASYKGHLDVLSILLHAGYSIEDVDPIGNRCLHLACSGGHRDVVELLLANSASVDQKNQYGNRPLDLATDSNCRKLLLKFQSQSTCEWCKESFSRIRRPSLCQHCHNTYCDARPCSSYSEAMVSSSSSGNSSGVVRPMRYCQECANEMGKAEQDLRGLLDAKLELIRHTLELVGCKSDSTLAANSARAGNASRPASGATSPVADGDTGLEGDVPSSAEANADAAADTEAHEDESPSEALPAEALGEVGATSVAESGESIVTSRLDESSTSSLEPANDTGIKTSRKRMISNEEMARALNLSQTDAEALYTAIEGARAKAADQVLIQHAKRTYHQLVAHVALQEEIKSLMVVRPIGIRSLVEPLKSALQLAQREKVSDAMLQLAIQVIQSAEAECTLFGCNTLCEKIELGSKKHSRDIARLEASISEAQLLSVNDKLLASAVALRDRLNAEIMLEDCLLSFTPKPSVSSETGVEITQYLFSDGSVVFSLLQALELRSQKITAAVEFGSSVEGVSAVLLEEGASIIKQLKKDVREEMKNEEERRRLEEEAALKAAKKGKKKKA